MSGIDPAVLAALKALGPFDPEWYAHEYPDVGMLEMDPAEHFLWIGQKLGRKGSERESLRALGQPHEVDRPRSDADRRRLVTQKMGSEEPIPYRETPTTHPSIAVVVHLFYDDLIGEICDYLGNLPYRFTACFSIRKDAARALVLDAIAAAGIDCEPRFVVGQNRGRNFAALLVDFREEARRHDLVLHIHTKKSLRTGSEQRDWRGHLFDGLMGTPQLVSGIIETFGSDPSVGLMYPTTYADMPVWCHSWLANSHRIDEISRKLGIDGLPRRGLIDYPVGAMFWARSDALAPMLDHPWTYDDFEPEPLPDDGSMAHVIERVFAAMVGLRGYDYLEIDPEHAIFRRNWSEKLLHRHVDGYDIANHCVHEAGVLSFDFYDTLFTRRSTTPEDVQRYIGWVLKLRAGISDENAFFTVRKHAEDIARQTLGKGDVGLDDIYGCFPQVCDWSAAVIAMAAQLEFDIETNVLVPRADLVQLARVAKARGVRLIITSDSYMPRSFFENVLEQHGMLDLFDQLYISSEVGMRKDRGDLWPYLLQNEVKANCFYHFGDNEHSDLQNPQTLNIGNVYVLNTMAKASLIGLGPRKDWRVHSLPWRNGVVHGPVIARFCSDAFLDRDSFRPMHIDNPRDIGYAVLGPLFFGFLTWVIDDLRRTKPANLFFLAREGWFLQEQYNHLLQLMGESASGLPEARYLSVSRRATLGAMAAVSFEPAFIVRGSPFSGTVQELLKARLGFDLDGGHPLAGIHLDTAQGAESAIQILDRLTPEIVRNMQGRHERLSRYLAQEGLTGNNATIVDVGYSGTIQSALQAIMKRPVTGYYMATFDSIQDVFDRGGKASGYFSDRFSPSVVRDFSLILEAILTAPHGQTIDYQAEGGSMVPIRGSNGVSQHTFDYLTKLNEGARQYTSDLIHAYGPEIACTTYDPEECDWGLRAIVNGTLQPNDDFWRRLSVEDDFCGNGELPVRSFYRI